MSNYVLLGDEALAVGAVDAGISAAYGYPGTPSSEIIGYLLDKKEEEGGYLVQWCSNEKTALEEGVGASMVGSRVLVTMKHVGLNVAADPFMNAALLAINGGLVVAVADDPGMHSSQNEQDSRYYADFAKIICLEPRNQQEVYDMTLEAFDISERFGIPVMIRLVTRIAHSRAVIEREPRREKNKLNKSQEKAGWMLLPATSRVLFDKLLEEQEKFEEYAENSQYNRLTINSQFRDFGVITTGLGGNYYEENLDELPVKPSHLHISVYPAPVQKIRSLAEAVDKIVVLEEGYPFVERYLRGILPQAKEITGKVDNTVPRSGELNPDNIRPALGLPAKESQADSEGGAKGAAGAGAPGGPDGIKLPGRPPQLCAGCPHKDSYDALNIVLKKYDQRLVTSDIGCYTLGYLPPHEAIETCLCMGASVSMAKGAAEAGFHPVIGVVGDSTFMHSGITALVDAVSAEANMTLYILDNSTTAMTGGQDTIIESPKLAKLIEGIGVEPDHIRLISPLKKYTEENAEVIREEIEHNGVSVIIARRDCIQTIKQKKSEADR